MEKKIYDLIIVGGGPAGLAAAIYAMRAGIKTMLIEKQVIGGQITITESVKNYPGFVDINGADFSLRLSEQAESLGLEVVYDTVIEYRLNGDIKEVVAGNGTFFAKTIILSMGASARGLNLPKEQDYIGRGVSYCAVCDGAFFKDKNVAVVGGGNSALQDVLYLAKLAKKVYHIHRRKTFKADAVSVEEVGNLIKQKNSNVEQVLGAAVLGIVGEGSVSGIKLRTAKGKDIEIDVDGIFVAIGREPQTDGIRGQIELDENGYILSDSKMRTNIAGVFCAGDVVKKDLRQIVTAVSDGAIAATGVGEYLRGKH